MPVSVSGNGRAYLAVVSSFRCRSLLLSLVFQPRNMRQEFLIQSYALYHEVFAPRGIFLLRSRSSSGNMSAGMANVDGIASVKGNF